MSFLDRIVAAKREEVALAKTAAPESVLRRQLDRIAPPRDFLGALIGGPPIRLIAEVKKASPSRGVIREDFDPAAIAQIYQRHSAACVSVLTDAPFFQGSLDNLRKVRAAIDLPVLRKDFIIDTYQVVEARVTGADAVLLIAECLDDERLEQLYGETLGLGMTPLVEFHEKEQLARVLRLGARLIGVNNRDLRTFQVDLEQTLRIRRQIPPDRVVVGESGIRGWDDVVRLEAAGVQAILVGEGLLAQPDIGAAVDELLGRGS